MRGKTVSGRSRLALSAILLLVSAACGQPAAAERRTVVPSEPPLQTAIPPSAASAPSPGATTSPDAGPDPVLLAAGDIAACSHEGDTATAAILAKHPDATVQTLGDNAYDKGTPRQFGCYHDTWGLALERTHPALGGHDYMTEGAAGYFGYFGDVLAPYAPTATDPTMGWYAYDLGQWRVIVLNSTCDRIGGCDGGSPQVAWLRAELVAHPATCSLAVIHNPRFQLGPQGERTPGRPALGGARRRRCRDGPERGQPRVRATRADAAQRRCRPGGGIRQFVVGTGGRSHYRFSEGATHPNTETGDDDTFGVLKLTLHSDAYSWEFLPEAGKTYSDSGDQDCH